MASAVRLLVCGDKQDKAKYDETGYVVWMGRAVGSNDLNGL